MDDWGQRGGLRQRYADPLFERNPVTNANWAGRNSVGFRGAGHSRRFTALAGSGRAFAVRIHRSAVWQEDRAGHLVMRWGIGLAAPVRLRYAREWRDSLASPLVASAAGVLRFQGVIEPMGGSQNCCAARRGGAVLRRRSAGDERGRGPTRAPLHF